MCRLHNAYFPERWLQYDWIVWPFLSTTFLDISVNVSIGGYFFLDFINNILQINLSLEPFFEQVSQTISFELMWYHIE